MNHLSKIIAVVGMTASGKSALALDIAKRCNGEIISVDSRQIYREMDIGTNKEQGTVVPVKRDDVAAVSLPVDCPIALADVLTRPYVVDGIPHYMISVVRPDQTLTLAHFKALAEGVADDILARGKLPILVGGTSLYTTAIVRNWQIPTIEPDLVLRAELEAMTTEQLVERLKSIAPDRLATIDMHNRRRLVRAIEIASQDSPVDHATAAAPRYEALLIAPQAEKAVIDDRINKRVEAMVAAGLIDEVRRVGEKYGYDCVAMTGHAYQQIGWFLQGKISQEEAIELSKKATRAYAKRQLTWWRKYGPVTYVKDAAEAGVAITSTIVPPSL